MINPERFLDTLRNSDKYIKDIYLNGGCYKLYLILKLIYPDAKPYINQNRDHVVTMIDNCFYDISGKVDGDFSPLKNDDIEECQKWCFSSPSLRIISAQNR